jgi:hypothetical protein
LYWSPANAVFASDCDPSNAISSPGVVSELELLYPATAVRPDVVVSFNSPEAALVEMTTRMLEEKPEMDKPDPITVNSVTVEFDEPGVATATEAFAGRG